jgi:hypothetical protein
VDYFLKLGKFYCLIVPRLLLVSIPILACIFILMYKPTRKLIDNNGAYQNLLLFSTLFATTLIWVQQGTAMNHIAHKLGL